ncbi:MAG: T9SS type A sorting domain-containing protein [Bacteroidota bacterium]|nr:T9SS type A sorting domain-containing protein [Bacteroidia bacterium]MBP8668124.1 T9SS type A sorting domain-containing protein [Bacteroidia bacterium]QQR96348.1 MAG: T9SS type A sorting domain-containing protein [Bacteroidota bacterium]
MRKLTILLLIFTTTTHAQEIEWQKSFGGDSVDILNSIQQTSDGGYILGGNSNSLISGDHTEPSHGLGDYWVLKLDATGNIQWQNTIGGDFDDDLRYIQQTTDGGYILGGFSESSISGDKTENSQGNFDYWVIKLYPSGNIQWQNTIGGNDVDWLQSIQQTIDGGYILGGWSVSDISGDKTENNHDSTLTHPDYWVVKLDAMGNIQWQNTIGGNSMDQLTSIQQTADGGYILSGWSYSNISGDKTENSIGVSDYWVVKLDSIGNIQWQNTIGGNLHEVSPIIKQTTDGGYILGGYSGSGISGDKTESNNGGEDYWVLKLDTIGNIQWQNTIGGKFVDQLSSIQQTTDGGYILGGLSMSNISGDKTENCHGLSDYWVLKLDDIGNIQWQNTIMGIERDELYSVHQTTDGGYILGGNSDSYISDDKTTYPRGNDDYWVIKLTDKFNVINGKLYNDVNNNTIQDAGEAGLTNIMITEQNTGRIVFSEQYGKYRLTVLDSGNFATYSAPLNYYNSVPLVNTAYFNSFLQVDSLNDFAFQPNGVFNDVCVKLTPVSLFRSGFDATYNISFVNNGTTTLSPTVIFFPDANVSFTSANVTPVSVTTDSVVWNIGALTPFQSGNIVVTVNVHTGLPIGSLINSMVRIEPVAGDANPGCNYSSWEVFTLGSFDPNDILVNRDTLFTTEIPNPPYLDYIIRFQNTGNDTAFNVKILNPLDTNKLQLNTLEYVASSHPVNINFIYHERNMEFKFDNILLPDSNVNEPLSHGFIHYRVKPKTTLQHNDTIKNIAAIYFDFNDPVITNTATTRVVLPTGIASYQSAENIQLFPNPAQTELNLQHTTAVEKIQVIDILGKNVFEKNINSQQYLKINISQFQNGVYFIKAYSTQGVVVKKFVKR